MIIYRTCLFINTSGQRCEPVSFHTFPCQYSMIKNLWFIVRLLVTFFFVECLFLSLLTCFMQQVIFSRTADFLCLNIRPGKGTDLVKKILVAGTPIFGNQGLISKTTSSSITVFYGSLSISSSYAIYFVTI